MPVVLEGGNVLAAKISCKLGLYGAWFFPLKRNASGILTLLEVAPRIAGTMSLNRARVINFPLLTLYERCDIDISLNPIVGKVKMSRVLINTFKTELEYQSVYIDFDDAVIVNNGLFLSVIKMAYLLMMVFKNVWMSLSNVV